jgi:DNA invertase Pin-like site-specific DNA recombinase
VVKQAFAYLRKSSVHDLTREVSHEVQEAAVKKMAARYGDRRLVILSDWNVSGRKGRDKRPNYGALLDAIEAGECSALYSYSLSRLGRSVKELANLIEMCTSHDVPVRIDRDAIDTSTASGKMTFHILASVAQFESDISSERQLDANAAKRAAGRPVGTAKPYGEAAGEDVDLVLAAFEEAGSYSGAARLLNDRGVACRTSKRGWWPSSVQHVVRRVRPEMPISHPTRGAPAGSSTFLLAQLLRCPTCGTRLTGTRDRLEGPHGGRVRYSCRLGSVKPHPRVSISEHLILPLIRAEAERLAPAGSVKVQHVGDGRSSDSLAAKRSRWIEQYAEGLIDKAERDRRLAEVAAALEKIEDRRRLQIRPFLTLSWNSAEEDPKAVNRALRELWSDIALDPMTFQPVDFAWRVPEWRREGRAS